MEVKFNTKDYSETRDIYELARGVFHHFDHDNITVDFKTEFDDNDYEVSIKWSSEPSYRDYTKLETLNNLIARFTSYGKEEK